MTVVEKLREKYGKKGAVADTLPDNGFFVQLNKPMKRK